MSADKIPPRQINANHNLEILLVRINTIDVIYVLSYVIVEVASP